MPDEIDIANDRAQRDLDIAIAAARAKPKAPAQVEACMNDCGELPALGSAYCSPECRDDHQARKATLRRQGVA